jgi:hypothetical protein
LADNPDGRKYRFGFNGQERDYEINSEGNINTAPFWEYDARLGRRWNVDPKPRVSESTYATFANNPIFFIDFHGDSAIVENSVKNDPIANEAFKQFVSTKEGLKFLSKYAAKGQTIYGHTFQEDGKFHKKGIDLIYTVKFLEPGVGGNTRTVDPSESKNGRANIIISLQTSQSSAWKKVLLNPTPNDIFERTIDIFHESFIHADLSAKDYYVDGKFDDNNISDAVKLNFKSLWGNDYSDHYQHHQVIIDDRDKPNSHTNLWPMNAFQGLKEVNKRLNIYNNDHELYKKMWEYRGGQKIP